MFQSKERVAFVVLVAAVALALLLNSPQNSLADKQEPVREGVVSVAHRGGIIPGIPENTLDVFQESIKHGVHAIEIDLRGTKDGAVVIMHDGTVNRTTNGKGKVAEMTLAELKQLDAGNGERIPTYEEVLKQVAGTGVTLLLDIKESPNLDKLKVVQLTQAHNSDLNVIIGVRNLEDYRAFRTINRNIRILGFIPRVEDVEVFASEGVDIIRLWPAWIIENPTLVSRVHQFGKPVWTTAGAAERDELEELIKLGVDGILTDTPALMDSILTGYAENRK